MTEKKSNIINIDGKEYNKDDLSKEQAYCINQLTDLQNKAGSLAFQLDQINASQQVFTQRLKESLEPKEDKKVN
tara:strand:- start:1193 stop:1414 length:222 start_codon:yes stop_codon:yes gene_type:complete